jgi:three-Cys-motif partner protein
MALTDDNYWAEYNGLQQAKHELLRSYLGGWFPILASWQGRVLYIDCHAGRGRHGSGHEGSPILALKLLLQHAHKDRILASSQVNFLFFENNPKNYDLLQEEIKALGALPNKMNVDVRHDDYAQALGQVINQLRAKGQQLAPSFAFVDPYGFVLPMNLLNDLLSFSRCELLINFMYRYVDMAIRHESQAANMDALFGSSDWRKLVGITDPNVRSNETLALFARQLKAEYVTTLRMQGKNGALKYVLIHAVNHRRGRELMKDAVWKVTPDGSFTASERNSPNQMTLIQPEPDLTPLRRALWRAFAGQSVQMNDLYDWLLNQMYLPKHLRRVLREAKNRQEVEFTGYQGGFAFNRNPTVTFHF